MDISRKTEVTTTHTLTLTEAEAKALTTALGGVDATIVFDNGPLEKLWTLLCSRNL